MNIKTFELKAKVDDIIIYIDKLLLLNPVCYGVEHQIDTYFNVNKGRLKLRECENESSLINYDRDDTFALKKSNVILFKHQPDKALKEILIIQLGVKNIVDKIRKIYFIDNVKFHFDKVKNLGMYIEVEALDYSDELSTEELKAQCDKYFKYFELKESDLIDKSYCDLL